jgi:flavin-dependent dehydrogenase
MPDCEYDVVVVGGSLSGCAAARLLALRGARVAVVEKRPELDAYKVICTHNIQAGALPAMERLGLGPAVREAGAVSAQSDIWTRYGWIRPPDRGLRSLNLRRSVLDPIVRRQAIETPGVDYLPGLTAVGLEGGQQVEGVRVSGRGDRDRSLRANGSDRELNRALKAYARRHRRELGAHHWFISDYSSGRRFSPLDKLVYSTAARDAELAGRVEDFGTRSIGGIAGARRMITRAALVRLGLAG